MIILVGVISFIAGGVFGVFLMALMIANEDR
jgi:hypothetical protein